MIPPRILASSSIALLVLASVSYAGTPAYNALINSKNPLVFLPFDETSGTTAADASGNGNNGTYAASDVLGVPSAGPGLKTAVSANGSVTPVVIPGAAAFDNIGIGDFTAELWFNTSNISTREDLFTFKGGSSDFGIHLGSQNTDELSIYHNGFIISSTTPVTANAWHNVAVTRSGGNDTLYLDGVSIGTGVDLASVNTSGSPIEVGSNTGNSIPVTGSLDEFAFYPSALSQADIQGHIAASAVPEPASIGLLAAGVAGMLIRRRRA